MRVGVWCKRLPSGYRCEIARIDDESQRALLKDIHAGNSYWVSYKTLATEWTR